MWFVSQSTSNKLFCSSQDESTFSIHGENVSLVHAYDKIDNKLRRCWHMQDQFLFVSGEILNTINKYETRFCLLFCAKCLSIQQMRHTLRVTLYANTLLQFHSTTCCWFIRTLKGLFALKSIISKLEYYIRNISNIRFNVFSPDLRKLKLATF